MDCIKRIYVEKKEKFNVAERHLYDDLKRNLSIHNLEKVRIVNRYDVQGVTEEAFCRCISTVFSEPPVDNVYESDAVFNDTLGTGDFVFAVKYLPGQYDQRADSAAQCIQIVTGSERPIVEAAKIYVCEGNLSGDDKAKIKSYCINPVDSMQASLEMPKSLDISANIPDDIKDIDKFIEKTEDEIISMRSELGLAMSNVDLLFCRKYFRDTEKRNPTVTEIRVIDTYWSDHCRHTTFLTAIENVRFDEGFYGEPIKKAYSLYLDERKSIYADRQKDVCLMDIAVMGMKALKARGKLSDLDESEEINACSIVVDVDVDGTDEQYLVMFKNETHNHPTEIEPFGGAATCLGGAIRDPLSGRSYVYQAMRVTGSGDPRTPVGDTLAGKLPQRKISVGAAAGYSSYGNQIGLATGQVTEIYDEGYVAKRMEIGAVIGAAKKENVVRQRPVAGDIVILVGGRTGRDGLGGATGSSKEHTEESILTCGAEVQKGNPPTERKLQRLFRNAEVSRLIKRCNDFGAGGVCVAVGELAAGLEIDLNAVPKKYDGLDATELAISESQERMAVVVDKNDAERFIAYAENENLEAVAVAAVTDDRRLKMEWRGKNVVDISRDFLDTNGARQTTDVAVSMPEHRKNVGNDALGCIGEQAQFFAPSSLVVPYNDLETAWLDNLKQLNVAAQKGLGERFDSTIGKGTVLMPFGGKNQLTPAEVMAARIPVLDGSTNTATMMSFGFNPKLSKWSPFHGAVYAVVESVSKIVAGGGDYEKIRLTFQEYFERMGTDPYRWGKPFAALLGAFYAQMELGIPSIGGKDSMSGTFKDIDVPPTLVSFAVVTEKTENIISPEFKKAGNKIVLLKTPYDKFDLPDFSELVRNYRLIDKLIKDKKIVSAHTVGVGGVAAAVSKMCFGNGIGAKINTAGDLFAEMYGSFVLELDTDNSSLPEMFMGMSYEYLGETTDDRHITVSGAKISVEKAVESWLGVFEGVYPTLLMDKPEAEAENITPFYAGTARRSVGADPGCMGEQARLLRRPASRVRPRVFIPVFPGTNCEYDTAAQFEAAGAIVDTFVIKNLNMDMLRQSIAEMARRIDQSQIIAISGGFSAGDEPEGSGKFIAAVFRNELIKTAVMNLLDKRDGLMLGICNGAQALIKLGLVPYGQICDMMPNSPTLTFNTIGRHISSVVRTKVVSDLSPWFAGCRVSDVHNIAVSHGEGRFVAEREMIDGLIKNGQIATQYVDFCGNASNEIRFNPNGSMCGIEGITSPDGRVLAKMGHSERIGEGLYKNVAGNYDQRIFESGVKYFS